MRDLFIYTTMFSYELIKKQQDEMRKVGGELDNVRAQLEIANRKAEEAKERNALLRAHLLDKKEAENENFAPKTNPDRQPLKPRQVLSKLIILVCNCKIEKEVSNRFFSYFWFTYI